MKKLVVVFLAAILVLALPSTAFAGSLVAGDTDSLLGSAALRIALKDAGLKKAQITKTEIDCKNKAIEVEFTQKKTKTEYEYTISKNSKKILEKEVEYSYKHNASKAKIGKTAALKKVAKLSGIKYSIVKKAKCTYAYKKNEGKYRIVFERGGYRHEFELLAHNGKIIEWEMDFINK